MKREIVYVYRCRHSFILRRFKLFYKEKKGRRNRADFTVPLFWSSEQIYGLSGRTVKWFTAIDYLIYIAALNVTLG